jgi:hypothetical protein
MTANYACRFVSERLSVSIVELAVTSDERIVSVAIRPGVAWQVKLPIWYFPSVGVLGAATIAVWSVARLYFLIEGKSAIRLDLQDEINAVYPVTAGTFCIVSELSVTLYDLERARVIDKFLSDDVLGASWWHDGLLSVENASQEVLLFVPTVQGLGYVRP